MGDSFAALASPALKSFANLVKKPLRRATFLKILRSPLFPEIPGAISWGDHSGDRKVWILENLALRNGFLMKIGRISPRDFQGPPRAPKGPPRKFSEKLPERYYM